MHNELLSLCGIEKGYPTGFGRKRAVLSNISLTISRGERIGLVGESGCGKTTLGMILAGLLRWDKGTYLYAGEPLRYPFRGKVRQEIGILFQHPETSFNPVLPLEKSMKEAYRAASLPLRRKEFLERMAAFGLYDEHLSRYPAQLSGGELQRFALLRALTLSPRFLVLDEPTSMLDGISQAQILKDLLEKSEREGIACLLITHDEQLAEVFCHRSFSIEGGRLQPLQKEEEDNETA